MLPIKTTVVIENHTSGKQIHSRWMADKHGELAEPVQIRKVRVFTIKTNRPVYKY